MRMLTTGPPVPAPAPAPCPAGPYQCVDAEANNTAAGGGGPQCAGVAAGFMLSFAVQPRTWYFFAAAPADQDPTTFRLSAYASCLPPAGTWSAPAVVPSLPFTSEPFCVSMGGPAQLLGRAPPLLGCTARAAVESLHAAAAVDHAPPPCPSSPCRASTLAPSRPPAPCSATCRSCTDGTLESRAPAGSPPAAAARRSVRLRRRACFGCARTTCRPLLLLCRCRGRPVRMSLLSLPLAPPVCMRRRPSCVHPVFKPSLGWTHGMRG